MKNKTDYNKVPLGEILTDEQIRKTTEILNSLDTLEKMVPALAEYFITIDDYLKAKKIIPEYLAYAVAYCATVERKKRKLAQSN